MKRPQLAWPRRVPRGLRARLTVSYTLAAAVLTLAGAALFLLALERGLRANLDDGLEARAATTASQLTETDQPAGRAPAATGGGQPEAETFAVYRRPDGQLISQTGPPPASLSLPPELVAGAGNGPRHATVTAGDEQYRLVAVPIHRPDGTWLAVAGASLDANHEALAEVRHGLIAAGAALVVVVAVGSSLLARAVLRPVERMRRDAVRLATQPRQSKLAVPTTGDELAALAATLNELLERLQRSLARQQELVADAGHELRTPLAVLRTELELAARPGRSRTELADAVAHAAVEADRLSQLADDLLFLARADAGTPLVRPQPTDLAPVLSDAARSARIRSESHSIVLETAIADMIPAVADGGAVRRAVDNLLANAIEHTPAGGTIRLTGYLDNSQGRVHVRVEDTGPGFPQGFLPHAFERFRRSDAARTHRDTFQGTGLGLAIVAEVVTAHGGSVAAENRPAGGARISVVLPVGATEHDGGQHQLGRRDVEREHIHQ